MNRIKQIKELRESGATLQEIGQEFGITRERVRQICIKNNIEQVKKTKVNEKTGLQKKRDSFPLSRSLFKQCSRKFTYKRRNNRNNKRAGWEFDVEFNDIPWVTHCPILGLKLDYSQDGGNLHDSKATFDRIDTTKGYIKGNVAVISWKANKMKASGSAEDHRKIANYIDKIE